MRTPITKYKTTSICLAASLAVMLVLSLFLSAFAIVGAQADTDTGDEPLIILENSTQKQWSQLTTLNIFANTDFNNENIIAPYSYGKYAFTVCNTARYPLSYVMNFSDTNEHKIPLEYRLSDEKGYLAGSDNEWVDCKNLNTVTADLANESQIGYLLEWRWSGDTDDLSDAELGILAAQEKVDYTMDISFTAEQSGEPIEPTESTQPSDVTEPTEATHPSDSTEPTEATQPSDSTEPTEATQPSNSTKPTAPSETNNTLTPVTPTQPGSATPSSPMQTGDFTDPALWLSLAIVSIIMLGLTIFFRRRAHNHENTDIR